MPLPEFTNDEQYLINSAKSPKAASQANTYMWGYLVGGGVVAGFGVNNNSVPMVLSAFLIVSGFRVYEEYHQAKWIPLWGTIIDK